MDGASWTANGICRRARSWCLRSTAGTTWMLLTGRPTCGVSGESSSVVAGYYELPPSRFAWSRMLIVADLRAMGVPNLSEAELSESQHQIWC